MNITPPLVVQQTEVEQLLEQIDVCKTLRQLFADLDAGYGVQPAPQMVELPSGQGTVINYLGAISRQRVYGVKTAPHLTHEQGSSLTAWTLLMSMETGQPLMLCDATRLSQFRMAATTALAIDNLASSSARRLAVIGSGPTAQLHLQYALSLRDWQQIRIFSADMDDKRFASFQAISAEADIVSSQTEAIEEADVIMLCGTSNDGIFDPGILTRPALITSLSIHSPRVHQILPESLLQMDVYCDYRSTTPVIAGEMLIAHERFGWEPATIRGDLPELLSGKVGRPAYRRAIYFRAIGLGLGDVALANALYRLMTQS